MPLRLSSASTDQYDWQFQLGVSNPIGVPCNIANIRVRDWKSKLYSGLDSIMGNDGRLEPSSSKRRSTMNMDGYLLHLEGLS